MIKQDYTLKARTFGNFTEYTLVKNGMPQICPFKTRLAQQTPAGGIGYLDQNCTDSCPLFKATLNGKKVFLNCGAGTEHDIKAVETDSPSGLVKV